jgi:hypothetical protein
MVTADDLEAASASTLATLLPAAGRAWSGPAGTLEWDCWHTAEHIGDCLLSYEALLHGQDIARGLGLHLDPPGDLCDRVLTRMFPPAAAGLTGIDSWDALQWATGRVQLPGRPQLTQWRWQSAAPGEYR